MLLRSATPARRVVETRHSRKTSMTGRTLTSTEATGKTTWFLLREIGMISPTKLHWILFGSMNNNQVCESFDNGLKTLVPFRDHPMAFEPLTIYVTRSAKHHYRSNSIECKAEVKFRWRAPENLTIKSIYSFHHRAQRLITTIYEYVNDHQSKSKIMERINMFFTGPSIDHGDGRYSMVRGHHATKLCQEQPLSSKILDNMFVLKVTSNARSKDFWNGRRSSSNATRCTDMTIIIEGVHS